MSEPSEHKETSFENNIDQLKQMIQALESGNLPLEQALETFEAAIQLSRCVEKDLSKAQLKIQKLTQQQGTETLTDFETATQEKNSQAMHSPVQNPDTF